MMLTIKVYVVPMVLVILAELRWIVVKVMKPIYGKMSPDFVLLTTLFMLLKMAAIYAAGWGLCSLVAWLAGLCFGA